MHIKRPPHVFHGRRGGCSAVVSVSKSCLQGKEVLFLNRWEGICACREPFLNGQDFLPGHCVTSQLRGPGPCMSINKMVSTATTHHQPPTHYTLLPSYTPASTSRDRREKKHNPVRSPRKSILYFFFVLKQWDCWPSGAWS